MSAGLLVDVLKRAVARGATAADGFLIEELFATEIDPKGQSVLMPTGVQPRFAKKFARYNLEVPSELFQRT